MSWLLKLKRVRRSGRIRFSRRRVKPVLTEGHYISGLHVALKLGDKRVFDRWVRGIKHFALQDQPEAKAVLRRLKLQANPHLQPVHPLYADINQHLDVRRLEFSQQEFLALTQSVAEDSTLVL